MTVSNSVLGYAAPAILVDSLPAVCSQTALAKLTTDAAVILLDRQLRIVSFTPAAAELIKLIPGDLGRPIGYIANLFDYDALATAVAAVLASQQATQCEIQTRDGVRCNMKISPCHSGDQPSPGVAITLLHETASRQLLDQPEHTPEHTPKFIRSILECCPDLIYIYDMVEQRNIYSNQEISTYLRYSPEQLKAFGSAMFANILHPDDMSLMLDAQQKMRQAADGEVFECEYRMKHADGSWRKLRSRDTVFLRDQSGQVQQILGFVEDISAQEQAKNSLRAGEQFAKAIADNIPAMVAYWSIDLRCSFSNKEYLNWFGLSDEQMRGVRIQDLMGEQLFQKNLPYIQAVLAGQDQQFERTLLKPNGEIAHVLAQYVAHKLNGEVQGFFALATDVTAIKQNQMTLKLNELSIQSISQGVIITDANRLIISVNEAFATMTGYSEAEILGKNCNFLQGPLTSTKSSEAIRESLSNLANFSGKVLNYRKDGVSFWNELSISPVCDDQGELSHFIGITRDITENQRVYEELERHQHQLEELVEQRTAELGTARHQADAANNAKSRFLAAASHDLRQPLAALDLYVGVLKTRISPANLDLVSNIQSCVSSLGALLSDLLDVSKLEAGIVTPRLSDFAIDEVLDRIVLVNAGAAERKNLRLRLRRSGIVVRSDQQLLHRIIGNLVDNAVHHTERGGVLIACRSHAGKRWLEVWDTGTGIPEDKTTVIFEEFRQLGDDARNRGSGLGLAIVAKTAALLGLQIRLCSRLGRGSMFALELPQGSQQVPIQNNLTQHLPQPVRIALVEDNSEVRQALVMALQSAGHEVIATKTGKQLLEKLGNKAPDMIISDYRLAAAETGFHVISAIRAVFGEDLPALLITGDTDPSMVRNMADQGITVQYKPLQIDRLQAFIASATGNRQSVISS